jgi:pteridine reductase
VTASQPVALITGAARRIGAALAAHLHKAGFRIIVHYCQSQSAAVQLVSNFNQIRTDSAVAFSADLCVPSAASDLLQAGLAHWGRLDLLVNNASIFSRDDADWDRMWHCNVQAPYFLSRAAFAALKANQGSIVNITDIHAHTPLRDYPAYCQTKAALAMQTRALAQEFAPDVRVNAIAPGAILWPEGTNKLDPSIQQKIIDKTLLKRHGTPEHIAQALLYLITNTYATGQSLQVDGGR